MSARRIPRAILGSCIALVAAAGFATTGQAAEFAGTWAADLENCKVQQESANAPVVISAKGYDQHEAHCTFNGLVPAGENEWTGKAACSVEGDKQSMAVKLTLSGDTLTLTEDGNSRDLLRCR